MKRSHGNFTVTDNLRVTAADYDEYWITAPSGGRLPGGGGFPICGLYDITPEAFSRGVNSLVPCADELSANVARMLHPGGLWLANHALPDGPGIPMRSVGHTQVAYLDGPLGGDRVVWYQRR